MCLTTQIKECVDSTLPVGIRQTHFAPTHIQYTYRERVVIEMVKFLVLLCEKFAERILEAKCVNSYFDIQMEGTSVWSIAVLN